MSEKVGDRRKPTPPDDDDEIDRSDSDDAEAEYERTVEPPDLDDDAIEGQSEK